MSTQNLNDAGHLMIQIHAGNQDAVSEISARFFDELAFFAQTIISPGSSPQAGDGQPPVSAEIVKQVLGEFWLGELKKFDSLPQIRNFLFDAVRQHCLNHLDVKREFNNSVQQLRDLFSRG